MKKNIFVLNVVRLETRRYPLRKVDNSILGYFSTLENAEKAMQDNVSQEKAEKAEDEIDKAEAEAKGEEWDSWCNYDCTVCYIIKEIRLNQIYAPWNEISIRTYSKEGAPLDESFPADENDLLDAKPFYGRPEEKIRFKGGDIVEYLFGNRLKLMIVSSLPITPERYEKMKNNCDGKIRLDYTDDCYLTYSLGPGDTHGHPGSCYLFAPTKKVPKAMQRKLQAKLIASGIIYGTNMPDVVIQKCAQDPKIKDEVLDDLESISDKYLKSNLVHRFVEDKACEDVLTLLKLSGEQAERFKRFYNKCEQICWEEKRLI